MSGPRPAALRHAAARRFHRIPATVTIRRPGAVDTLADPNDPVVATTVHTGTAHVDVITSATETEQASAALTSQHLQVHVAVDADVAVDDLVTFETSGDSTLTGRVGTVVALARGDWQATRPLTVELVDQEVS